MNFFESAASSANSQNILLAVGESLLKTGGYATNLFSSSLVENDACNFSSISFLFNNASNNNNNNNNMSGSIGVGGRPSSYNSTTSILYSQKQVHNHFIIFLR